MWKKPSSNSLVTTQSTSTQCNFVLSNSNSANDIAKEHKRKKVIEADVYQALSELGFDKYVEQLKDFMVNYNADKEDLGSKN